MKDTSIGSKKVREVCLVDRSAGRGGVDDLRERVHRDRGGTGEAAVADARARQNDPPQHQVGLHQHQAPEAQVVEVADGGTQEPAVMVKLMDALPCIGTGFRLGRGSISATVATMSRQWWSSLWTNLVVNASAPEACCFALEYVCCDKEICLNRFPPHQFMVNSP
jgi:hypothetical protein